MRPFNFFLFDQNLKTKPFSYKTKHFSRLHNGIFSIEFISKIFNVYKLFALTRNQFWFFFQISWKYLFLCCENVSVQYWLYPNFSMPLCYWERLCKLLTVKKKLRIIFGFPSHGIPPEKLRPLPRYKTPIFFRTSFFWIVSLFVICLFEKRRRFSETFPKNDTVSKRGSHSEGRKLGEISYPQVNFFTAYSN